MDSAVLVHIPHASVAIYKQDSGDYLRSEEEMSHELIRLTDWYTDELFGHYWPLKNVVQFQHSRLVVDVERFAANDQEPCAKVGMGATYEKTTRGGTAAQPVSSPSRRADQKLLQSTPPNF